MMPLLVALIGSATSTAQGVEVQRAIERLEGCDARERRAGCVTILKERRLDDRRLAVKAQVRGSRIIWYEYDMRTGRVRRTN